MAGLSVNDKEKYTCFFQQVHHESETSTGKLNMGDFEKLLKICGLVMPRRESAQIFVDAHCDGNWKISQDEFLDFISQVAPSGSPQSVAASLRCHFNKNDVNSDGYLSLDELRVLMSEFNLLLDEDWLQAFIEEWGTDGDGRVNFEEFVKVYIRTEYIISGSDVIEGDGKKTSEETTSPTTDITVVVATIRRICSDREQVEDGMVSVVDLRCVLDELKVNVTKDDIEDCFSFQHEDCIGRVVLDKFLHALEDKVRARSDDQGGYQEGGDAIPGETSPGQVLGEKEEVFKNISDERNEEKEIISGEIFKEEESSMPSEYKHMDVRKLSATFEGKQDTKQADIDCHDCGAKSVCEGVCLKALIARFENKAT